METDGEETDKIGAVKALRKERVATKGILKSTTADDLPKVTESTNKNKQNKKSDKTDKKTQIMSQIPKRICSKATNQYITRIFQTETPNRRSQY